jgi:hypothetical protein
MLADEQQRLRIKRIQSVIGRRSRFGDLEAAGEPLEGTRELFYLLCRGLDHVTDQSTSAAPSPEF